MGYQIKVDGYLLHDLRLDDEKFIVLNPKCTLEVNTVGTASFLILSEHPNYGVMKKMRSIFEILQDEKPIFRGRMTGDTRDFDNTKLVDLEGVLAFFNDSVVKPFVFPDDFLAESDYVVAAESGNVVEFFLNWLIEQHNLQTQHFQNFKIGRVTVSDPNNYLSRSSTDYASTWETLKSKLFDSALGGYLCIRYEADGNYIDYLEDFEFTNSQPIEYGENLLDLSCESDASATYSAIIPLGTEKLTISGLPDGNITNDIVKNGDTLYSNSAVEQYGWIYAPVSETTWDDVTIAENLQSKGVEYLKNTAIMLTNTITIKAFDLHFSDEEIEAFRIYGYVPLLSKPHDQEDRLKLTKLDLDLQNPQNTVITLGEIRLSLTDINAGIKRDNEQRLQDIIKIVSPLSKKAVVNSTVYYYLSESASGLSGGSWSETPPAWIDGRYYWQKIVVTYADGTTSEGNPVCITGGKGSTGANGVGVSGIKTQFYLSKSKTEQSGGSWVDAMPDWSTGYYLWTRSVITYTDGTTEYTEPICDCSWEAVNELEAKLPEMFTSRFEQFADEITLEITGSLGSVASIVMTAGGVEHKTELELSKVRQAFANDDTEITISAGLITFNSGTIVINSDNFSVTSSGIVTATGATITGNITAATLTANTGGSIAGWTIDDNSFSTGTLGKSGSMWLCRNGTLTTASIGSSGSINGWCIGIGTKFGVTKDGELYCTSAHLSGSMTATSGSYEAQLNSGGLKLYYDGSYVGQISSNYGGSTKGISFEVVSPGQYIMFEVENVESMTGNIAYVINNGWTSNYDEVNLFYASTRFVGAMHFGSAYGQSLYMRSFIKSMDADGNVGEELIGYSSDMVRVGSVGCATMLRGTSVYLKNTSTTVTSDRNAKNSIEALPDAYETVFDSIEPVRYKYNEGTSGRYHVGYIAQDVEAALTAAGLSTMDFAGFVDIEKSGDLGLMYDEFIALLHMKIKRLENRIAALENN